MTREDLYDIMLSARTIEELDAAESAIDFYLEENNPPEVERVAIAMGAEQLAMTRAALEFTARD